MLAKSFSVSDLQSRLLRVPIERLPLVADLLEEFIAAPTDEEAEDALDAAIIVSRKDEEMEPLEDAIKELRAARK